MSILSFLTNPVTFAAMTVIAIGVVIYEVVNKQNEERHSYHGSKRPRPNRRTSSPSSDVRNVSCYEDAANNVRRRKQNETKAKPSSQIGIKSQDNQSSSEVPTHKFDEDDYCQNVYNKIDNDVKNLNKDNDDKKTFQKNIDDYPANNTSVDVEEIKVLNIQTPNENLECVQQTTQNVLSSKGNICKQETNTTSFNDPCCSHQETVANDMQNDTETDNPFCMACEEVLRDAVNYPCKHCYLCISCATKIHRIYKKCSLCNSEIEYFQPKEK